MVCQSCGNPVTEEIRFCPRCGAQITDSLSAAPPVPPTGPPTGAPLYIPPAPRVQKNLQLLGILWCIFGAYRAVAGFIGIFAVRIMSERQYNRYGWTWHANFHHPFGPPWVGALIPFIAITAAIMAALAFLVGFGLLSRQSWGRVLGIVVAILSLLKFPIGTALGIYTLWVLAPMQSRVEYDAIAQP
jgi:hypothetical protein